jgi:hypothetical protein
MHERIEYLPEWNHNYRLKYVQHPNLIQKQA